MLTIHLPTYFGDNVAHPTVQARLPITLTQAEALDTGRAIRDLLSEHYTPDDLLDHPEPPMRAAAVLFSAGLVWRFRTAYRETFGVDADIPDDPRTRRQRPRGAGAPAHQGPVAFGSPTITVHPPKQD